MSIRTDGPEHDRGIHQARSNGDRRTLAAGDARPPESSISRVTRPLGCASREGRAYHRSTMTHLPSRRSRRRLRGAPRHPDPWPSARPTTSISSCSARAPAATRRPSAPPSSASRSPSSTRTRSAGRASIAAASRPRRSSSRPRFADRVRHAKDYGVVDRPATPSSTTPQMAARRDQVVKRMWTGLKTLIDKNKVTWVAGRGRLDGAGQGPGQPDRRGRHARRRRRARPQRDRRHPRDRIAGEVAARARPRTASGSSPATTSSRSDTLPKDIVIVGAGAVGVEFASHVPRPRGRR